MMKISGMTVVVPCDYSQTKALHCCAIIPVPYTCVSAVLLPIFTDKMDFKIGKDQLFEEGKDVSIFACGHLVLESDRSWKNFAGKGYIR